MGTSQEWQELASGCSIEEFATKNLLDVNELINASAVLILPNNLALSNTTKQHLFSPYSKEVLSTLRDAAVEVQLYRDSRERRELVRKSADIILPILAFGSVVSNVALGVISNWIYVGL